MCICPSFLGALGRTVQAWFQAWVPAWLPFALMPSALATSAWAQNPTRAPWLLAVADSDQDGTTDGVEWELFQRSLPAGPGGAGTYDRATVLGRCMLPFLDPESMVS